MRILILGATGRTGKQLLRQALDRGYQVNALVRNPKKVKIKHSHLVLIEGSPADRPALDKAMQDCDAVVSALNISRTHDFPWAPLRSPKDLLSKVMGLIIEFAPVHHIDRIVFISAWGVAETRKDVPAWFRWFIDNSNLCYPYVDHEKQEQLISSTGMKWTAVRPVFLTNSKKKKPVHVSLHNQPRPKLFISRSAVASFMLDILEKRGYIKQRVVVYS